MEAEHGTLLGLLLILSLGLIVPDIIKRTLHLPFVTSIILIGSIIGPNGFDLIQSNEVIDFFGFLGFTFLMLLAGLETHVGELKKNLPKISILAFGNASIPFATGLLIGRVFGYDWLPSILLGTIFVSSSVAVIIPFMNQGKLGKDIRQLMLPAFVLEDLFSMMLLASVFQAVSPITTFPLPVYFGVLLISIGMLFAIVPRITKQFLKKKILHKNVIHEDEVRFVIVLLIAVLLYFSALGVHPILAAFLIGMLLADVVTSDKITEKIHTLGYGLFVPVFFFIVGMEMNMGVFLEMDYKNILIIAIIAGLLGSKFISGYISGKIINFSNLNATIFGTVSTAQLTTTLAAAYAASAVGLFDSTLITAIVAVSIVSNILVPFTLGHLVSRGNSVNIVKQITHRKSAKA